MSRDVPRCPGVSRDHPPRFTRREGAAETFARARRKRWRRALAPRGGVRGALGERPLPCGVSARAPGERVRGYTRVTNNALVEKAKKPKRDLVTETDFDIVVHNITVGLVLDLVEALPLPAYLEEILAVDPEITLRRT